MADLDHGRATTAGPVAVGKVINFNIMGGSELDLNDAELWPSNGDPHVLDHGRRGHLRARRARREVSDFAFMGGNDVRLGSERPTPGGPTCT